MAFPRGTFDLISGRCNKVHSVARTSSPGPVPPFSTTAVSTHPHSAVGSGCGSGNGVCWHAICDPGTRRSGAPGLRFEFGYMGAQRTGTRNPPPRAKTFIPEFRAAATAAQAHVGPGCLIIGGKSMGGRVALMAADDLHRESDAAGLLCLLSLPPSGQPEKTRTGLWPRSAYPPYWCRHKGSGSSLSALTPLRVQQRKAASRLDGMCSHSNVAIWKPPRRAPDWGGQRLRRSLGNREPTHGVGQPSPSRVARNGIPLTSPARTRKGATRIRRGRVPSGGVADRWSPAISG
ncbi:alpha/beta family hydrolase [Alsobacter sp. SYSU BS001988]